MCEQFLLVFFCDCDIVSEGILFSDCSSAAFVRQILLPLYLTNGLINLHETDSECSSAPTDDLIRFWRSEVKVTAGLST